jgi:amidase
MAQLMAVEGVMARHIADVRAGLQVVAGPHARDPLALPVVLADLEPGRRLRVAVEPEPPGGSTHPGVAAAIRRAADALADAGADVVEVAPDTFAESVELWARLLVEEVRAQAPLIEMVMGADGYTFLTYAMELYGPATTAQLTEMHVARNRVEKQWHRFLSEHDVLLSPVWAQPALPHGYDIASMEQAVSTFETLRPVVPLNLLGLPGAVVPVGFADGLPVGAQVAARRFSDLAALSVAQLIVDVLGDTAPVTPIDPR